MDALIRFVLALVSLVLGLTVGKIRERAHFRSLRRGEEQYRHILLTNLKRLPPGLEAEEAFLCTGSVVVASDYWKVFAAGLKHLVGGRLRTIETLVERARREALVRLVESASERGANCILNVRFETSTITRGQRGRAAGVEVLAYGTGVRTRS